MTAAAGPWRLLPETTADAARQMATDEVLLDAVASGQAPPTLRFYRFRPPALSLGRHQLVSEAADLRWCAGHGVDVVRRPTGGGAVLHEIDGVTYALAAPLPPRRPGGCGVAAASLLIGEVLREGLASLGLHAELARHRAGPRREAAACCARASRHEILVGGRKLAGSAQLRRRSAFLQHGTILLGARAERQRAATAWTGAIEIASPDDLAAPPPRPDEIADALRRSFARLSPGGLEASTLAPGEAARIERLRAERYLDAAWTLEGRTRRWAASF